MRAKEYEEYQRKRNRTKTVRYSVGNERPEMYEYIVTVLQWIEISYFVIVKRRPP